MGETMDTLNPFAYHKDNLLDVASCQQAYDTLKDISCPLNVDASGINSTDSSIVDSATIDSSNIKKKKNKKKGKKNLKFFYQNIRTSAFQSSNFYNRTVSCHKNSQLVGPAGNTSVCACETNGGCLKDATGKLNSECLCCGPFELTGNFVHSAFRSNSDTVICGRGLREINPGGENPNDNEKKFIMHCNNGCINELKENLSCGDLAQYMSCGTDSIMSSTSEGSNGSRTGKAQLSSQNTSFRNAYAAYPSRCDNVLCQSDIVDKTRCQHNIQIGKENSHSVWTKSKKHNRDVRNHGVKTLNHIYVRKDVNSLEKSSLVKSHSFSSNGLLPTPTVPSAVPHAFAHEVMKNKQGMYSRTQCNVLAEPRCQSGLSQVDPELRQDQTGENKGLGKLKEKRYVLYKHENLSTNKKRAGDFKANSFWFRNKTALPQKEACQIPGQLHQYNNRDFTRRNVKHNHQTQLDELHCSDSHPTSTHVQLDLPHRTMPGVLDCELFPGVQPYTSTKIPRTEHVSVESLQASLYKVQRDPFCLDMKNSYEDNIRQDFSSRVSLQKWVPVGKKDSEVLKKIEAVYVCNSLKDVPDSCNGSADLHLENIIPVSFSSVDPEKTCSISSHDKPKVRIAKTETLLLEPVCKNIEYNNRNEGARDYPPPCNSSNGTPLLYIGSQMAIKALDAAYQLQIVSESIQLATGSPLAEFEKLLQLACPVIAPSSAFKHCDVCLGNQLPFSSLCKHQLKNIPLRDVWSWYEKPGNYGLEVRAEDSKNLNGMDTDSVAFNAHFVPFLSAIQLFGHSQKCRCGNSVGDFNSEIPENGEDEFSYFRVEKSIDEPEDSPGIISANGHDFSSLSSAPSCSNDMELIFEFFENEQPQQRKPLHDKVRDLLKVGTSNHQVYGDPSRLDCMYFGNIHPASWYSVAWYPIYRIPEGNFRASFLTYHSLGHLVQRCRPEPQKGNSHCVVSPVLGLQSYNAQGECWFYPKIPEESSSKGFSPFNSSEILKERLRTLEETALIFARGCVYKDHVEVTNRQPDYEFFLSRKR